MQYNANIRCCNMQYNLASKSKKISYFILLNYILEINIFYTYITKWSEGEKKHLL